MDYQEMWDKLYTKINSKLSDENDDWRYFDDIPKGVLEDVLAWMNNIEREESKRKLFN